MSKLLNAVVKFPASKIIKTQYGNRVNAVLKLGENDITIWANADSLKAEQLKALRKGEQVQIIEDNGKYKLLESDNQTSKIKADYEPASDEKKRMMMGYIQDIALLYSYCRETSIKVLVDRFDENEITEDTIRSMTATLFITTQKRFGI